MNDSPQNSVADPLAQVRHDMRTPVNQILGYSEMLQEDAEAAGQNLRLLNSGKQSPEFYREMWDTLQRGEPWSGAMINRRGNGCAGNG